MKLEKRPMTKKEEKQHAKELYRKLPHGSKMKFVAFLADRFNLSKDYIHNDWFNGYKGVPNVYMDIVLNELKKQLKL